MLHVIGARCVACDLHTYAEVAPDLHTGHLSVCAGNSLQRNEIVKNLKLHLAMRLLLLLLLLLTTVEGTCITFSMQL